MVDGHFVTVIKGRFREPRLFLIYAFSVLRPGMDLPTFSPQELAGPDVEARDEDLQLIVDEARRQLDRQQADLVHLQARASTLLTIVIAEIALIASTAPALLARGPVAITAAIAAFSLAALALGGTSSIIASKAVLGAMDVTQLASIKPSDDTSLLREAARGYVRLMPPGLATNQARITVLRDAVLLAVLAAAVYAPAYVWTKTSDATQDREVACIPCQPISTTPSPTPSDSRPQRNTSRSPAVPSPAPSKPNPSKPLTTIVPDSSSQP
jgi:hypothetical protein